MDLLAVVSLAFSGGLVIYGLVERWRIKRGEPRLVTIKAASAGTYVRIVGKIVDGGTLVAPITGRTCVSFDAVVLVDADGPPTVVTRGVRGTPFIVDDGTGRILVDPRGAFIHVIYDKSQVGPLDPGKIADPDLLAPLGTNTKGLRFDEGVLSIGEHVAVAGLISRAAGAADDPVYRRLSATELRLTGGPARPAVVSERPEDL